MIHDLTAGDAPHLLLSEEVDVQRTCYALIQEGYIRSAHDVSDGGFATCLAECSIASETLGADVQLTATKNIRLDAILFGEAQSRIVLTIDSSHMDCLRSITDEQGVTATLLGIVTDGPLVITVNGTEAVNLAREKMSTAYNRAIPAYMN